MLLGSGWESGHSFGTKAEIVLLFTSSFELFYKEIVAFEGVIWMQSTGRIAEI